MASSPPSVLPAIPEQLLGSTTPRVFTPPLITGQPGPCGCGCALTPETSLGFTFDYFATEIVGRQLDPWQRWLAIHALELLHDGRPRFRQVLVLVARQNGKTEMLVLLTLFWLFVQQVGLVLGTSTKLDYARESWLKVVKLALSVADLAAESTRPRRANGEQEIGTVDGSRYKIAASNEEGGRSLTVHRLVEDELRQHHDWSAHEAAENAMNAVEDAQAWAISNAGDDRSVVLNSLQASALEYLTTGAGDERLGLFEYSAPEGCDVTDPAGWAAANPNLGRRIDPKALAGKAVRAKSSGGEQEAKFRTEVLCQRVNALKPKPITPQLWAATERDVVPFGPPAFFVAIESGARSGTIAVAADAEWPHLVHGQAHTRAECPGTDAVPDEPDQPCTVIGPHVELADHRTGTAWLPARIIELHTRYPEAPIAAMAKGPVADLAPELTRLGFDIILAPSMEMVRACGHLEKLGDRFTHSPDQIVDASIAGAEVRRLDQATWGWDWKTSKGNLAPIMTETNALWLLEQHRDDEYNLMDSFG